MRFRTVSFASAQTSYDLMEPPDDDDDDAIDRDNENGPDYDDDDEY